MNALQELLETRNDIWRGRNQPHHNSISTGQPHVDQLLPDQGWPCGQLIELHAQQVGHGELSILLPLLAHQTQHAEPVVLLSPPLIPCPQTLIQAGIVLDQLLIIESHPCLLWACEQILHSGGCGALLLWLNNLPLTDRETRRLQLACEHSGAPMFVIGYGLKHPLTSRCALRLQIDPGPSLKCLYGTHVTTPMSIPWHDPNPI